MTELTPHNYAEIHPDKILEGDTILWQRSFGSPIPEVEVKYVADHNSHAWFHTSGTHFLVERPQENHPDFSILTRKDRDPDYSVFVKVKGAWYRVGGELHPSGYATNFLRNDAWEVLEPKDS